jgi:type I restriction enzyme, S subunit
MVEAMEIQKGYKQTEVAVIPEDWDAKPMSEICNSIASGKSKTNTHVGASFPIYGSTGIIGFSSKSDYEGDRILIARVGANAGTVNHVDGKYCVSDNTLMVQLTKQIDFSFIFYFLTYSNLNKLIFGSGQPLLTGTQLKNLTIPLPPTKAEQTAIATALNDADALITQLEQLIAKKRAIKQGAMQELLKPKDGWEVKRLGEILKVRHGKSQKEVAADNGVFPILASGGVIGRAKTFLYDKPSVLIGRKGTIDEPQYMDTPFWSVDTLFYTEINREYDPKFIFYIFNLIDWYSYNEASGVPSLNAKTIELIEKQFPKFEEQTRIAQILSDMDAEIEALENKLNKYKMIKQGMMQNLLTGRIRLV